MATQNIAITKHNTMITSFHPVAWFGFGESWLETGLSLCKETSSFSDFWVSPATDVLFISFEESITSR